MLAKPDDAAARRLRYWRRTLGRGCGRTPTALLKLQIEATAALECKRELIVANPAATATDAVQIARECRIQREILAGMIEARKPAPPAPPGSLLDQYLAKADAQ